MTLQEFIDNLLATELEMFSLDLSKEEDLNKTVNAINMGLLDLYTRFPLKDGEVTVQQYENITMYTLSSEYAESNTESTEQYKWISDVPGEPFTDDIIRVERVFNEVGVEIPLNNYSDSSSLFLAAYNVLQIPCPISTNAIFILYRARHPVLSSSNLAAELELPPTFLTALTFYAASRISAGTLNQESQAASGMYIQKYNAELQVQEKFNVTNDSDTDTNIKLLEGGWV